MGIAHAPVKWQSPRRRSDDDSTPSLPPLVGARRLYPARGGTAGGDILSARGILDRRCPVVRDNSPSDVSLGYTIGKISKKKDPLNGMAPKQEARTLYTISCACGAQASMDARAFGRPQVCKKCGGSFTVGWGKDPATQKSAPVAVSLARRRAPTPLRVACACGYRRAVTAAEAAGHNRCPGCGKVMIVEKPAPTKARESDRLIKLPTPPPPPRSGGSEPRLVKITPGTQVVDCVCGEKVLVRGQATGQPIVCPGCNRRIRLELKEGTSVSPSWLPPGGRTPTPPPGTFTKPELSCECGANLEIVKALDANGTVCSACGRTITMEKIRGPQSKHTVIRPRFGPKTVPPATAPPPPRKAAPEPMFDMPTAEFVEEELPTARPAASTYQEVFCPCGEALMVGTEDVGKNMQCPTCLTLMAVDLLRDSRSGNAVLRVRAIGKMDQDTWSLSDFS
jgi:hypothetical protein